MDGPVVRQALGPSSSGIKSDPVGRWLAGRAVGGSRRPDELHLSRAMHAMRLPSAVPPHGQKNLPAAVQVARMRTKSKKWEATVRLRVRLRSHAFIAPVWRPQTGKGSGPLCARRFAQRIASQRALNRSMEPPSHPLSVCVPKDEPHTSHSHPPHCPIELASLGRGASTNAIHETNLCKSVRVLAACFVLGYTAWLFPYLTLPRLQTLGFLGLKVDNRHHSLFSILLGRSRSRPFACLIS